MENCLSCRQESNRQCPEYRQNRHIQPAWQPRQPQALPQLEIPQYLPRPDISHIRTLMLRKNTEPWRYVNPGNLCTDLTPFHPNFIPYDANSYTVGASIRPTPAFSRPSISAPCPKLWHMITVSRTEEKGQVSPHTVTGARLECFQGRIPRYERIQIRSNDHVPQQKRSRM